MATMSIYRASSIVEGFANSQPTRTEYWKAWALLIKSGAAYSLQGWYGRSANELIERGCVTEEGELNWDVIDEQYPDHDSDLN